MFFHETIVPEIVIFLSSIFILLAFLWMKEKWSGILTVFAGFSSLLFAVFWNIYNYKVEQTQLFFQVLQFDPLFTLVKAGFFFAAFLLLLLVFSHEKFSRIRRMELSFFVLNLVFFSSVLILSRHFLASFICVAALIFFSTFFSTLLSKGAREIALKLWLQSSICFCIGLGALVVFLAQAPSLLYGDIRETLASLNGLYAIPLVVFLLLPFWCLSGLFPFHFVAIDQNRGLAWPLQAIQSVLVQGVGTLALLKIIVLLFFSFETPLVPYFFTSFSILGFCGVFYGGLGALTQANSKRFSAYFVLMQWSSCLIVFGELSSLALSAVVFRCLAITLALTIYFWVLALFSSENQGDGLDSLCGAGRHHPFEGGILFAALISLAGLPPTMGFLSTLQTLGVLFEGYKWPTIAFYMFYLLVQALVVIKLIVIVFFKEGREMGAKGGALAPWVLAFTLLPLFYFGLFANEVLISLIKQASAFLIF